MKKHTFFAVLFTGILIAVSLGYSAGKAKKHVIDASTCTQCGLCIENCPQNAISVVKNNGKEMHIIDPAKCDNCGKCIEDCPVGAISLAGVADGSAGKHAPAKKAGDKKLQKQKKQPLLLDRVFLFAITRSCWQKQL